MTFRSTWACSRETRRNLGRDDARQKYGATVGAVAGAIQHGSHDEHGRSMLCHDDPFAPVPSRMALLNGCCASRLAAARKSYARLS